MTNFSTQKERILQFIDYKGISKNKFYIESGISNGVLDKKSGLSMETVEKFYSTFPEINPEWLLTGNGSMLKEKEPTRVYLHDNIDDEDNPIDNIIPLIPIGAMAGSGTGEMQIAKRDIIDGYVIPEFTQRGVEYIIRVSGSSMYPKYSSGDLLGCKTVTDLSFFQWGKIYVLDTDQGPMVKRLFPVPNNDDLLECRSDNKEYPPFPISKSSIYKVAIVIGVLRME
ncbi:S24 family peptidase [Flavobacterium sasangense]|uniref:S24 family peptidase n=1 Tax=Flavobacterium sasangense TaxID=503361 RepID=UPI0005540F9E|nr:S24 family peptidase [Flavobacterium sasangense]